MSRLTFEQLRLPLALVLLAVAAFVLFPRGDGASEATASPSPSVVVGEPGGAVVPTDTPLPSPRFTPAAEATATASPTATATPVTADGFTAEVLACRSISGSTCNGQLGNLPPNAGSFTALVRFTDATAGDTLNALLDGPSGRIDGFPYTLEGGGDGYYYTTFTMGSLPPGTYTVTATRNGVEVARTSFRKVGG